MVKTKRRSDRSRVVLSLAQTRQIRQRLTGVLNNQASPVGYVCSDPWAYECVAAIARGRVQVRKEMSRIEGDLHRAGVYPPGGSETAMVENTRTLRYMPPDYTGTPLDEREDTMSFAYGCKMPGSSSAAAIELIALMRSRPAKGRVH
jgi:hypothetical protein